jgi:o-succinylbenzoate synthase
LSVPSAELIAYDALLRRPWRTSQEVLVRRCGLWVRLTDAAGRVGWGDVVQCAGFGSGASLPQLAASLRPVLARWPLWAAATMPATGTAKLTLTAVEAALAQAVGAAAQPDAPQSQAPGTAAQPATALAGASGLAPGGRDGSLPAEAYAGLELALLDLLAQQRGCRLADLLCDDPAGPAPVVPVHALVDSAVAAQAAVRAGARTLKVKLGSRSLDDDLGHVAAIFSAVPPDVALRLDANGAWPLPVARQALNLLAAFSPEFIEQPVAAADLAGMASLRRQRAVPVAADEAVRDAAGLRAVLAAEAADVAVLKPAVCGGLLSCRRLAAQAAAAGLQCVITHAVDSAVGRGAAAQLAAALAGAQPRAAGLSSPFAPADEPTATTAGDRPPATYLPHIEAYVYRLPPAASVSPA